MNQPAPQLTTSPHTFTQLLSSTRRGARLARLLTVSQLQSWSAPQDLTERAEIVVAELAANAVLHGRLPGRSFRLTLVLDPPVDRLRVEVTDARGDLYPQIATGSDTDDAPRPGGRGLSLVTALADHWDCVPYPPTGKTVRAVLSTRGKAAAVTR
ncbi:ATP-binding protein [Streptomyces cyaneochromogenes]|uniref:ATP-binding protein n=1 Tax=Streptomyces cyaneochromogenes TaxID=2496836 RepID=A0A3S9MFX9_9ACTN|nr:ATP-binding protein [Streptomyces cyaneochromogenes]AZQ38099.1 ATP-binding protein [Streptomyces cyaneochromogenes]